MDAQEYYHFTLNGLETCDWQQASGGVRLDLWERGRWRGSTLCRGHWNVTWSAGPAGRSLLKSVASTFLHSSSTHSRPQNYSWSRLSSAHLCILYADISGDPVTLCCYITRTSAPCRAKRRAARVKDHRLTNVVISDREALKLGAWSNYLWLLVTWFEAKR